MSQNVEFKKWLNEKLKALQTDPDVFGDYITGILLEEETEEEKTTALTDLLSEIVENDLEDIIKSILNKWCEYNGAENTKQQQQPTVDLDEKLSKLLEAQKIQTVVQERTYTEEEKRIREQILSQYAQREIKNEDDFEAEHTETASTDIGIERNTNKQDVIQLQKERREQARLDSAAKKQKDKEDREKQRQLREEKKEKRKTVKGERRR